MVHVQQPTSLTQETFPKVGSFPELPTAEKQVFKKHDNVLGILCSNCNIVPMNSMGSLIGHKAKFI